MGQEISEFDITCLQDLCNRTMKMYDHLLVNTVAWAPYEYGLMLACGSSDGSISIITSSGNK